MDEREELERLRAEVARLRAERDAARAARRFWRPALAGVLVVLGCVLAAPAVVATWLRSELTDTDRYVATVAPLADDPAVQRAVADRVTTEIFRRIDVATLTRQAADGLADQGVPATVTTPMRGLAEPVANGVESWARGQIANVVASDEFARAWREANRVAHAQLQALLTGDESGALVTRGDTVSLRLAPFVDAVKQRLVAAGFTIAERIPEVNAELVLFRSPDIGRARLALQTLVALGTWLPAVVLGLVAAGVLAARSRRRAMVGTGIGLAAAMLVLAAALAAARPLYLQAVPAGALPADAAAAIFDTVVVDLRVALRTVLAVGLLTALGAFLTGPAPAAVAARRWSAAAMATARRGARRLGLRTGPVGGWIARHRPVLRAAVVAVAAMVFVFWDYPTARVALGLALGVIGALAVIELLAAPRERRPGRPGLPGPAPT